MFARNTIVKNALLVTMEGVAKKAGRGIQTEDLGVIEKGALITDESGKILWVGEMKDLPEEERNHPDKKTWDADHRAVLPGLIDSHTHLCFGGNRAKEFERRLSGESYQEIAAKGGGIWSTVVATREASLEELCEKACEYAQRMNSFGTMCIEAKSGYGLNKEAELKQLKVYDKLRPELEKRGVLIKSTFLGPHSIPKEHKESPDRFVDEMIELLPEVKEKGLADFVDVFVEEGYFNKNQGERFFKKAKELGFGVKVHADELSSSGGTELAVEMGALSADHLIKINKENCKKLAESQTVATILPGTSFYLNETLAPARELLDQGACLAIATDFNPGSCMSYHLSLMASMACIRYKLSVAEALAGITYNAAKAMSLESQRGALMPGFDGALTVLRSKDYQTLLYHYGENHCFA